MSDGLVVDVGATSIKWQSFHNELPVGPARRRRTPRPCTPIDLLEILEERVRSRHVESLAVGFPGDVVDGVILDPANLARVDGPGSIVLADVLAQWDRFPLEAELQSRLQIPVVVVNDARAAALGCDVAQGRHLILTLGTGLGVAMVIDGVIQEIDDVGGTPFGTSTFDELVGERARAANERRWLADVVLVIQQLRETFATTKIHLAGGNARRISGQEFAWLGLPVVVERENPALRVLNRLRLSRP